jgi:hypothetical protein
MYVNAKITPVEMIPGIGGRRWRRAVERGANSSMLYLMHCKNLCKWHNVPPPSTTLRGKKTCSQTKLAHKYSY